MPQLECRARSAAPGGASAGWRVGRRKGGDPPPRRWLRRQKTRASTRSGYASAVSRNRPTRRVADENRGLDAQCIHQPDGQPGLSVIGVGVVTRPVLCAAHRALGESEGRTVESDHRPDLRQRRQTSRHEKVLAPKPWSRIITGVPSPICFIWMRTPSTSTNWLSGSASASGGSASSRAAPAQGKAPPRRVPTAPRRRPVEPSPALQRTPPTYGHITPPPPANDGSPSRNAAVALTI